MSNEDNDRLRRLLRSEEETRGDIKPAPQTNPTIDPAPKTDGTTPVFTRPALDKDNMPLPRRVDEIDLEGTRVTPAAYQPAKYQQPVNQQRPTYQQPAYEPPQSQPSLTDRLSSFGSFLQGNTGCFLRGLIISAFLLVIVGLCLGSIFVYQYAAIARTLPDSGSLRDNASQFETTRILDRNGQVLYELLDPNAGRRNYIPLANISPNLIAATIATEDKDFYSNPGFDPIAITRA